MAPSPRSAPEISSAARCDGCGLAIEGGRNACQELFEREMAREFSDCRFARHHRMAVDTYALQHPDRYCASAKSLAAHLTGMCAAIEHPGHPTLLRDLQQWLSGPRELVKPPLPSQCGEITIADVLMASEPDDHAAIVRKWASSTWGAYRDLHGIAREWVALVLR